MLEILYQDQYLIAVNKPPGLAVHRSSLVSNTNTFALQVLRDQVNAKVYPCHRLDRKTSGVLLFAMDQDTLKTIRSIFEEGKIRKRYQAIVRGYAPDEDIIDYPLTDDSGRKKEAITSFKTIDRTELDLPFGKFETSRYSLVEAFPQTGRMHQIRRHFAHIFHPIIGDRPHGCNKQNKLFLQKWNMKEMLLHAQSLVFDHPVTKKQIKIEAQPHTEFIRIIGELGLKL